MHIVPRQPNKFVPRIGVLDCLPVFFDLKGKTVLVAGSEPPAAWKAELLAATGARVFVFCGDGEMCDELAALKTVTLVAKDWREADWEGFSLAVGNCAEDEAEEFVARARVHGVPVNVIDRPEFCQFQFGSIVNRSPLVIGISTNGAAPILGQAVRQRIEAVLPEGISRWAKLARKIRESVMARLRPGAERRAFWERFAAAAFSGEQERLAEWIAAAEQVTAGHVTLVGAGPGAVGGLTLNAVRALQAADVIIHDVEIGTEVLELARREAKRQIWREDEEVAEFAMAGLHVVRLVYGAGEMMPRGLNAQLARAGVKVNVVPGLARAREGRMEYGDANTVVNSATAVT